MYYHLVCNQQESEQKYSFERNVCFSGEPMSTSNRNSEGCSLVRYGVDTTFHVSRRGARGSGTVDRFPENSADASGSRTGGCQQRRGQRENSAAAVVGRQQR